MKSGSISVVDRECLGTEATKYLENAASFLCRVSQIARGFIGVWLHGHSPKEVLRCNDGPPPVAGMMCAGTEAFGNGQPLPQATTKLT